MTTLENVLVKTFKLRYLGLEIELPEKVSIVYDNTGFDDYERWKAKYLKIEDVGPHTVKKNSILGLVDWQREKESKLIFYVRVASDEIIRRVFPKTRFRKNYRKAIRTALGGHEEVHACSMTGNLGIFLKSLEGLINQEQLNPLKKEAKLCDEWNLSKVVMGKNLTYCDFSSDTREIVASMGSAVALLHTEYSTKLANKVLRTIYKEKAPILTPSDFVKGRN